MRPVLFDIFGFPMNSYGVSKALAALVAAYLLGREFRRLGWDPERAWNMVMAATVLGFAGGKPSNLPWAMAFPNGTMPTLVPVHPTALYESAFAFVLAGLLWWIRRRIAPLAVFGLYAVLSGTARFLVEEVRINKTAILGMTQPQLWSLVLVAVGAYLLITRRRQSGDEAGSVPDLDDLPQDRSVDHNESLPSPSATR